MWFSLAAVVAGVSLVSAAQLDPKYAANITVFHVNEKQYPANPDNMNTANINGDIYFSLRTRGFPLECGKWKNESFWSMIDCVNGEVDDPADLAITKLVLEVDTRFGDYADCNVDSTTGVYSCSCQDVPDDCSTMNTPAGATKCNNSNGCEWVDDGCYPHGCPNITDHQWCTQGYHHCDWNKATDQCGNPPGPAKVCNGSQVGFLNLSNVEWGRTPFRGHSSSTIDFWHGNTLAKTRGYWYSTWTEGQCRSDDPTQQYCSWRVAEEVKKITKACSDSMINAAIIAGDATAPWGGRCFDDCTAADRHNASSECFILCFYKNVLGPKGSTEMLNYTNSPEFGITVPELLEAWEKPFKPESSGGCPALTPSSLLTKVASSADAPRRATDRYSVPSFTHTGQF